MKQTVVPLAPATGWFGRHSAIRRPQPALRRPSCGGPDVEMLHPVSLSICRNSTESNRQPGQLDRAGSNVTKPYPVDMPDRSVREADI